MTGVPGWLLVDRGAAFASTAPLQATSPSAILDVSGPVRGLAAFVLVTVLGGLLLWRHASFVERSAEASMGRPLSSLGYGAAAHAVIAFGGVYLTNQLAQLEFMGQSVGAVGVFAGVLVVVLAASLGFVVVGSTLVSLAWEDHRWYGLVVGAAIAGVAGALEPLVGGILWFVVVSMGIGGPARRWLHEDEISNVREYHRE